MVLKKLLPIAAALCLLACACTSFASYPMKVKDVRGKQVAISSKPVRIVSLTPNITEMLYALGLRSRIVGVNKDSNFPPDAKNKPSVGDMSIDAETVVSLRPDLVVAHAFINEPVIPRLERLGLKVFATDPKTIGQVIADIRTLGEVTARPRTAEIVTRGMEQSIARVKNSCAKKTRHAVLVVIQSNPLWAVGPKTFVSEMIQLVHGTNVAADARPGFVPFSRELAISRNPEVIIVGMNADRDFFLRSPAWRNTDAVKHKRVYVINNDLLVRPGPRLTEGLEELAKTVSF